MRDPTLPLLAAALLGFVTHRILMGCLPSKSKSSPSRLRSRNPPDPDPNPASEELPIASGEDALVDIHPGDVVSSEHHAAAEPFQQDEFDVPDTPALPVADVLYPAVVNGPSVSSKREDLVPHGVSARKTGIFSPIGEETASALSAMALSESSKGLQPTASVSVASPLPVPVTSLSTDRAMPAVPVIEEEFSSAEDVAGSLNAKPQAFADLGEHVSDTSFDKKTSDVAHIEPHLSTSAVQDLSPTQNVEKSSDIPAMVPDLATSLKEDISPVPTLTQTSPLPVGKDIPVSSVEVHPSSPLQVKELAAVPSRDQDDYDYVSLNSPDMEQFYSPDAFEGVTDAPAHGNAVPISVIQEISSPHSVEDVAVIPVRTDMPNPEDVAITPVAEEFASVQAVQDVIFDDNIGDEYNMSAEEDNAVFPILEDVTAVNVVDDGVSTGILWNEGSVPEIRNESAVFSGEDVNTIPAMEEVAGLSNVESTFTEHIAKNELIASGDINASPVQEETASSNLEGIASSSIVESPEAVVMENLDSTAIAKETSFPSINEDFNSTLKVGEKENMPGQGYVPSDPITEGTDSAKVIKDDIAVSALEDMNIISVEKENPVQTIQDVVLAPGIEGVDAGPAVVGTDNLPVVVVEGALLDDVLAPGMQDVDAVLPVKDTETLLVEEEVVKLDDVLAPGMEGVDAVPAGNTTEPLTVVEETLHKSVGECDSTVPVKEDMATSPVAEEVKSEQIAEDIVSVSAGEADAITHIVEEDHSMSTVTKEPSTSIIEDLGSSHILEKSSSLFDTAEAVSDSKHEPKEPSPFIASKGRPEDDMAITHLTEGVSSPHNADGIVPNTVTEEKTDVPASEFLSLIDEDVVEARVIKEADEEPNDTVHAYAELPEKTDSATDEDHVPPPVVKNTTGEPVIDEFGAALVAPETPVFSAIGDSFQTVSEEVLPPIIAEGVTSTAVDDNVNKDDMEDALMPRSEVVAAAINDENVTSLNVHVEPSSSVATNDEGISSIIDDEAIIVVTDEDIVASIETHNVEENVAIGSYDGIPVTSAVIESTEISTDSNLDAVPILNEDDAKPIDDIDMAADTEEVDTTPIVEDTGITSISDEAGVGPVEEGIVPVKDVDEVIVDTVEQEDAAVPVMESSASNEEDQQSSIVKSEDVSLMTRDDVSPPVVSDNNVLPDLNEDENIRSADNYTSAISTAEEYTTSVGHMIGNVFTADDLSGDIGVPVTPANSTASLGKNIPEMVILNGADAVTAGITPAVPSTPATDGSVSLDISAPDVAEGMGSLDV